MWNRPAVNSAKQRVDMFVFNAFRPDIRVLKEAETLTKLQANLREAAEVLNWQCESKKLMGIYEDISPA